MAAASAGGPYAEELTLTMICELILCVMALCALASAVLFVFNLRRFRMPAVCADHDASLDVLVPARNEEANIGGCVESVLRSSGVRRLRVMVLDDSSTDRTAAIVADLAQSDPRVRLVKGVTLPGGWNGKQHACWQLAQVADAPLLLFLDADVRLAPDALVRCCGERQARGVALLSGFPRIITTGFLDGLLLPLIHFVLLSYLPMRWMQRGTSPGFAAGCGQFMLVDRTAYFEAGGHAAIRESRHDGLRLPQIFRKHGFRTDVVNLSSLAETKMYSSARDTWNGLAKNAVEGMAAPSRLWLFTLLLLFGQVLPALLVVWILGAAAWTAFTLRHQTSVVGVSEKSLWLLLLAGPLALAASLLVRRISARRFQQPVWSALLHPLGVAVLLALQWYALARHLLGKPVTWRARSYSE